MAQKPNTEQNFWNGAAIPDYPNACWPWRRYTDKGYGILTYDGKTIRAHRCAYQFAYGSIDSGKMILHTCANKRCVNPNHLYQGGASENAIDAIRDRGHLLGEKNHNAKLNNEVVIQIRRLAAQGIQRLKIAKLFSVTRSTVNRVVQGTRWGHVL